MPNARTHESRTAIPSFFIVGAICALSLSVPASFASAQTCELPYKRPYYKTRSQFCDPGQFVQDAYAPGSSVLCEEMEVDHLVSLYHAWSQGVCGEDLRRLANDDRNLRFTHWRTNRAKGAMSPEEFAATLPPSVASNVIKYAGSLRREYGFEPLGSLPADKRIRQLAGEVEASKQQLDATRELSMASRNRMVTYRGKRMQLAAAVSDYTSRTRKRLVASAQKNFGAMFAEALPFAGIAVIAAATALEINDYCKALKDNHELDIAFNPEADFADDAQVICALEVPTKEELREIAQKSPGKALKMAREVIPTLEDVNSYEMPDVDWEAAWSSVLVGTASSWDTAKQTAGNAYDATAKTTGDLIDYFEGFWGAQTDESNE